LGIILLTKIKYSFQLDEETFKRITNNNSAALECFRNPTREELCGSVTKYMSSLNYGRNDKLNTNYAINIINAVKMSSWDISTLDFREGEISSDIFNVSPPSKIRKILLSNIMTLKKVPNKIPDSFIQYLDSCPFESSDNIKVINCSSRMNNLCSSKVSCVKGDNDNANVNTNPKTNPLTNINNPSINNNDNVNTNRNNINTINNTNSGANNNNSQIMNNKNGSNNDINNNKNNTNVNNNTNSKSNNNDNIGFSNVQVVDTENDDTGNTKTLVETFLFGLCTSVGILIILLILLCIAQKYSNKNIVNKISYYYEKKPLVKSSKSGSSSNTDSTSMNGTTNTQLSSSSQTSYTNVMKHKRYLYVFDDGSVMMSKSLKNKNNGNGNPKTSGLSSSGGDTAVTNPIPQPIINNNTLNVHSSIQTFQSRNSNIQTNSKLSISTASSNMNNDTPNIIVSPSTNSPIELVPPAKVLNRNSITIEIPKSINIQSVEEPKSSTIN
jgi:hypothetical protein